METQETKQTYLSPRVEIVNLEKTSRALICTSNDERYNSDTDPAETI